MTNNKYFVKTRNWHCHPTMFKLLSLSHKWGVERGDGYNDGDGKFILETNSLPLALATWLYWMVLRHWTGGWTYIVDTTKHPTISDSKCFYL